MDITEISMIHHSGIVLVILWLLNSCNFCHAIAYFIALVYLYLIHERYVMRLRRKLQFQERKQANQKRVLTDSETVRWLNHAVEKIWPICMEQIVSQRIFLPIIPWFLDKYKPWTVKKAVVQHLYLGRAPPIFTEMRVLRESTDDDHLVLELGLNFLTADDMSAILAAKLRKRLGFGILAKMHLTGMHVEGKVLIGVKFLHSWPFIGRLRVCFAEPPYFQMTVKPIFSHGLDVTELPGIAGWLDKLLSIAFEQTLVEPNMLVVDLEKFVSPQQESWFSVDVKEPIAYANLEVIEAAELKPSDLNGLADPYVKGNLGQYRFRTQIQKKTLTPKWQEEFRIPINSWESQNILAIEVRDKDHFVDDNLGNCAININNLGLSQRHDMWVPLENIKMGRLHLAITVVEANGKQADPTGEEEKLKEGDKADPPANEASERGPTTEAPSSTNKSAKVSDTFEAINVEGQKETGIWVHHPGSEVPQSWEPRKGKSRLLDTQIPRADTPRSSVHGSSLEDSDSDSDSDENLEGRKINIFQKGMRKINSAFHRQPKRDDLFSSSGDLLPSPHPNVKPVHAKRVGVNLVVDGGFTDHGPKPESGSSNEGSGPESSGKGNVKGVAKDMLKNAGKSAKHRLKQVLSKKGSRKFSTNSEAGLREKELPLESDSSDEDSLSSTRYDSSVGIPIASSPISEGGNDPMESKQYIARDVPVHSAERLSGELKAKENSEGSTELCGLSPNAKLSEEKIGEDDR